jgi:hypothetical protein|tara:strand:+ start:1081 stop:1281 length:201 start_codon:yes stop_codon:yes gene_type:complete
MIRYKCDSCGDVIDFTSPTNYIGTIIFYPEGMTTDATIGEAEQRQTCRKCLIKSGFKTEIMDLEES